MTETESWDDLVTIKLSREAAVVLGYHLSNSYTRKDYAEFSEWGVSGIEALDELCTALEMESVLSHKSQSEEFWKDARTALMERIK